MTVEILSQASGPAQSKLPQTQGFSDDGGVASFGDALRQYTSELQGADQLPAELQDADLSDPKIQQKLLAAIKSALQDGDTQDITAQLEDLLAQTDSQPLKALLEDALNQSSPSDLLATLTQGLNTLSQDDLVAVADQLVADDDKPALVAVMFPQANTQTRFDTGTQTATRGKASVHSALDNLELDKRDSLRQAIETALNAKSDSKASASRFSLDNFQLHQQNLTLDTQTKAGAQQNQPVTTLATAAPTQAATSNPSPVPGAIANASTSAAPMTGQINAPIGTDQWRQSVQQHALRLSHAGKGHAQITLSPPELGKLNIYLQMGDQAHIHFTTQNAQARAALESALPQLQQAFADSGLDLGQASVGDQSSQPDQDGQHASNALQGAGSLVDDQDGTVADASLTQTLLHGRTESGGIDTFA